MEEEDRTSGRRHGSPAEEVEVPKADQARRPRRFVITCTARATIRESWLYEAEDEYAARKAFDDGVAGVLIDEAVLGEERNRLFLGIEPVDPHPRTKG